MAGRSRKIILIISLVDFIILVPAVILVSFIFGDRHYYIAGVVAAVLACIPFFVGFEGRKPDSRALAMLAVMTAIAVISRVAFIWLPNFKPMAGVIIITAIAFGPQSGFMCGALSMLVSNIIFGQGPWTVWQMLCYGMIGFIAGLLGRVRILSEKHAIRSAIIGFITVFILSGLILDTCSVVYFGADISWASAAAIYLAGIPVNITNSLASAICVFILIKPIVASINRLRDKYGIVL